MGWRFGADLWDCVGTPAQGLNIVDLGMFQSGSTNSAKDRMRAERPDIGDDNNCTPNFPVVGWYTDTTVYSHRK